MLREITLTEARRQLASLLQEIREDPEAGYRILVRQRAVAELRSPQPLTGRVNPGLALLQAARKIGGSSFATRRLEAGAARYKELLYGKKGILGPGGKR